MMKKNQRILDEQINIAEIRREDNFEKKEKKPADHHEESIKEEVERFLKIDRDNYKQDLKDRKNMKDQDHQKKIFCSKRKLFKKSKIAYQQQRIFLLMLVKEDK